ncbi:hypothetical protein H5410_061158 [Solanum commersonii]|uniref:Uncharacterized protein n=1 Tax=Solanum commersonii TaxID=4109 RepID=A0A9J5W8A7_SOLCO|nr:hypothetical protein H5410_061158 [Solanum commersonii]
MEQKVIFRPIGDLPTSLGDPQAFISSFFLAALFLLANATRYSIMNIHNKTQFIHARINCVPKDSSCDTPFPKILKLAILASHASSSSTKVFECPHTKDDFIFTHKSLII